VKELGAIAPPFDQAGRIELDSGDIPSLARAGEKRDE
jgi:hypothetical protein